VRKYKDEDGGYLAVVEEQYGWSICWIVNIDGDQEEGLFLGEDLHPGEWDNKLANTIIRDFAKEHPDLVSHARGKPWMFERKTDATNCLTLINAALLKGDGKPWPTWALQAEKAGWKAPKGWKP
jgi:hypothetical protein